MTEASSARPHVELPEPHHGWGRPSPNVFELAGALPTSKWTLVGGLMVQAHAMAHGIEAIRPTTDLDVLLPRSRVAGQDAQRVLTGDTTGLLQDEPRAVVRIGQCAGEVREVLMVSVVRVSTDACDQRRRICAPDHVDLSSVGRRWDLQGGLMRSRAAKPEDEWSR